MRRLAEAARQWCSGPWPPRVFRCAVVAGAAATLAVSWPVWKVRGSPPLLPLVQVPQFDIGGWLLAALGLVLIAPRTGLALYGGLTILAIVQDQTRLLPQAASWFFLLLATLPAAACQVIGRAYLVSMWFFAGFHKLASPVYFEEVAAAFYQRLFPGGPAGGAYLLGGAIIACELALALLAVWPRGRAAAALLATVFHLSTFVALRVALRHAALIEPWNLVLAGAGWGLLVPWKSTLCEDLRAVAWPVRAAAVLVLVMPAGYYLGLVDAHLAHNVYAHNTPKATLHTLSADLDLEHYVMDQIGVPLPANHAAFEAYFRAAGKPGQSLEIHDPRWCAKWFGYDHRVIPYRPPQRP